MSSATTDRGLGPRVLVSAGATYIASNVDNRVTVNAGGTYKVEHHYHNTPESALTQIRETRIIEQDAPKESMPDACKQQEGRTEIQCAVEEDPIIASKVPHEETAPRRGRARKVAIKNADEPRKTRRKQPLSDATNIHEDTIKIKQEIDD